jgi:glycosyltransferase involved in cell wall biosynthesis
MKIEYLPVHVLIPALDRPALLDRALSSISRQSYQPASATIITDPDSKDSPELKAVCDKYSSLLPLRRITNERKLCVSGAINTGLYHLPEPSKGNDQSFVAILDDDDWWERKYLENCVKYAMETGADWVIAGLIRHFEPHPDGLMQKIPHSVAIPDFLVGNPNIQNSSIFIRSSALRGIGGYDESLVSTTDRDICIRLLQNKYTPAVLFNHLVHHDAFARPDRLSTPGSSRKTAGMRTFYAKYSRMMKPEEKKRFKKRALKLFSVDIPEDLA